MINLRYHIVSLTAVFLAIGIGLTLGSTFLDRATVDNLNGQLTSLEDRLADRDTRIDGLEEQLGDVAARQQALDDQAAGLLAGRLDALPVVVLAARGVDEGDVARAVSAMSVAGADVQGLWWFTERLRLDDAAATADLATALEIDSTDPSRLRRTLIDELGGVLRARQLLGLSGEDDPAPGEDDPATGEDGEVVAPGAGDPDGDLTPDDGGAVDTPDAPAAGDPADDASDETTAAEAATTPDLDEDPDDPLGVLVEALITGGFVEFEPVTGGAESPMFPEGARLLFVGGSTVLPDDVFLEPLLSRMGRATDSMVAAVVTSAMETDGGVSDIVAFVRQSDDLREIVASVDHLDHFDGWAATILALADLGDDVVGHYGLGEGASRLLPPQRVP